MKRRPWYKTLGFFLAAQILLLLATAIVTEIGMSIWSARLRGQTAIRFTNVPDGKINFSDANLHIVATGDSHTFGIGAGTTGSYPAQLARLIHHKRPDLRPAVINVAFPGYNSSQALRSLTDYFLTGRRADVALLSAGTNNGHNLEEATFLRADIARAPVPVQLAHLLEHSRAYKLSRITTARIEQLLGDGVDDTDWVGCVLCKKDEPMLIEWLAADFREMVRIARSKGAKPVLVGYWMHRKFIHEAMSTVSRETGTPYVINEHFNLAARHKEKDFLVPDNHPNAEGYERIANAVYLTLLDEGLLPPRPPEPAP